MLAFGILLIISGIVIIVWPQIIAYILGGLLLFFGLNILFARYFFSRIKKTGENYVKFGSYKIYKD